MPPIVTSSALKVEDILLMKSEICTTDSSIVDEYCNSSATPFTEFNAEASTEGAIADCSTIVTSDLPAPAKPKSAKKSVQLSEVWNHYTMGDEGLSVTCKHCGRNMKRTDSSTKSMWGHLSSFHLAQVGPETFDRKRKRCVKPKRLPVTDPSLDAIAVLLNIGRTGDDAATSREKIHSPDVKRKRVTPAKRLTSKTNAKNLVTSVSSNDMNDCANFEWQTSEKVKVAEAAVENDRVNSFVPSPAYHSIPTFATNAFAPFSAETSSVFELLCKNSFINTMPICSIADNIHATHVSNMEAANSNEKTGSNRIVEDSGKVEKNGNCWNKSKNEDFTNRTNLTPTSILNEFLHTAEAKRDDRSNDHICENNNDSSGGYNGIGNNKGDNFDDKDKVLDLTCATDVSKLNMLNAALFNGIFAAAANSSNVFQSFLDFLGNGGNFNGAMNRPSVSSYCEKVEVEEESEKVGIYLKKQLRNFQPKHPQTDDISPSESYASPAVWAAAMAAFAPSTTSEISSGASSPSPNSANVCAIDDESGYAINAVNSGCERATISNVYESENNFDSSVIDVDSGDNDNTADIASNSDNCNNFPHEATTSNGSSASSTGSPQAASSDSDMKNDFGKAKSPVSLQSAESLCAMHQIALDLNLAYSMRCRADGTPEFNFQPNNCEGILSEHNRKNARFVTLTETSDKMLITERELVNGGIDEYEESVTEPANELTSKTSKITTNTSTEVWVKSSITQLMWAVRGKCQKSFCTN